MEYEELCQIAVELAKQSSDLAMNFVDRGRPTESSSLNMLTAHKANIGSGVWVDEDIIRLYEALRGLIGIAGAQMNGLSRLSDGGVPIMRHPLMTLVRGVAEACGNIAWLTSPWIVHPGEVQETNVADWCADSAPVLSRLQLLWYDAEYDRRRRILSTVNVTPERVAAAEDALSELRTRFETQHGLDNATFRGTNRNEWSINGEKIPYRRDLASRATEYSHGPAFVGAGIYHYPTMSGFAHASLDFLFMNTPAIDRPGMQIIFQSPIEEFRDAIALSCRLFAAHFDMSLDAFGLDKTGLTVWERGVTDFVVNTENLNLEGDDPNAF
jgi:hypothetical protein